jgi:hypothetical protein
MKAMARRAMRAMARSTTNRTWRVAVVLPVPLLLRFVASTGRATKLEVLVAAFEPNYACEKALHFVSIKESPHDWG